MPEQEQGMRPQQSTMDFLHGLEQQSAARAAESNHMVDTATFVPVVDQVSQPAPNSRRRAGAVIAIAGLTSAAFFVASAGGDGNAIADSTIEITAEDLDQFNIASWDEAACDNAIATVGTAEYNSILGPVVDLGFRKPDHGANADQNSKMSADAVHNPFTTEDKYTELYASICENDVMRVNLGQFLANLEIDGVALHTLDGNAWLERYAVDVEQTNDIVADDLELIYDAPEIDPSDEEAVAALLEATQLRENDAERMIELLNRLYREGVVGNQNTVQNYRHGQLALTLGIPEVELGPEYNGDFLVFTAITKNGDCVLRFGFNAGTIIDDVRYPGDQRLAILVCETPSTVTTVPGPETPTTVPAETTTTRPNETTTTRPGDTTTTTRPDDTTTTTRPGDKIVYCITPDGAFPIVDRNQNGLADEVECQQLQDNGPGSGGNGDDTPGTTSTTEAPTTTQGPNTTPTTGTQPTAPPAPPTTAVPPPSTVTTQPPRPDN